MTPSLSDAITFVLGVTFAAVGWLGVELAAISGFMANQEQHKRRRNCFDTKAEPLGLFSEH
jgi:hypothetical protein